MVEQVIADLRAQGWSHLPEVLASEDLGVLNEFFETHLAEFSAAKVGHAKNLQRNVEIRGDFTRWIDDDQAEFQKIFSLLETLKKTLNQNFFLGLKDHEAHLAFYPPGYFYQKHVDRFEAGSTRVISFVFYLHQEWVSGDGGELVLYNKNNEVLKILEPLPGSLVIFLSEDFPHEVKKCFKTRRSFTGWIHNRDRGVL
jgi:SM-20-related protein